MHLHALSSRPASSAVERLPYKQDVAGSIPVRATTSSGVDSFLEKSEGTMSDVKQVIVVRKDLNMRKGKIAAQVAHASMKFLVDNNEAERGDELNVKLSPAEAEWLLSGSFTKIVVGCDSEDALQDLIFQANLMDVECHPIVDAGKTEFDGVATLTCAAFGPCSAEELDKITGNLKLI